MTRQNSNTREVVEQDIDQVINDINEIIEEEPFTNMLSGFNETCMIITVIFLILFMNKEEIMKSKFIKGLLK